MENEHSPLSQRVKPVKLAAPVSLSSVKVDHTFVEAANSYGSLHDHYCISWPHVYLESWPEFQV